MSEMIERVVAAMEARSAIDPVTMADIARAAIEALREPTAEMKAVEGVHWDYGCHVCGGLKDGWQGMIDAALGPSSTEQEVALGQLGPCDNASLKASDLPSPPVEQAKTDLDQG